MSGTITVLLYHDFCKSKKDLKTKPNPLYTTTEFRFIRHTNWLVKKGYVFISVDDLPEIVKKQTQHNYCMITFDGPYSGWTVPVGILANMNIKATFYVTTAWVGSGHPNPGENSVDWRFLRMVVENPLFAVGSHSVTHRPFNREAGESQAAFADRILLEMKLSKMTLNKELRQDTMHFASPWGYGQRNLIGRISKMVGYSTIRGTAQRIEDIATIDLLDIGVTYGDAAINSFLKFTYVVSAPYKLYPMNLFYRFILAIDKAFKSSTRQKRRLSRRFKYEGEQ